MKRFVFPLEAVLRYRRSRRGLCRQFLARILADDRALAEREAELAADRRAQLEEIRALDRHIRIDVDRSMARRFHAAQLQGERRGTARNRQLLAQQIAACRRALVEADRDVKALEMLRGRREAEHRVDHERRAAREMEEAWMALHAGEFTR
ncbi:MAG: hypothetical protein WD069_15235 [Planctomycetales bacterium]